MLIRHFFSGLLLIAISNTAWAQAMPNSHAGHGGGNGGGDEPSCMKARVSHFKPDHLATVSPGAEFTFTVSGSNGPGHIHVSARQEPIAVSVEDKETFFQVRGKLPEHFKNDTVRLSVRVKAKISKCDTDSGILLKVTE